MDVVEEAHVAASLLVLREDEGADIRLADEELFLADLFLKTLENVEQWHEIAHFIHLVEGSHELFEVLRNLITEASIDKA